MSGDEYDVVVVGSGAGGGAVTAALVEAGLRVCMLEKGPHYTSRDFVHDEVAMCRRNFFTPSPFEEPNLVGVDGGAPKPTSDGWISCCVGGGTVHMGGFFYRMRPEDFQLRARYGAPSGSTLADWPIGYRDLEPFYDDIEQRIGVSGNAAMLPVPQRALPLVPLAQHPGAKLVDDACKKLGRTAFQTPRALISTPHAGRASCHYCGFCASYGCEVGAKSSSDVALIAPGLATGKLELVPGAMVLRIETTAGKASGVVWTDGNVERRARGRVVVVAGGAIQTARLLLASGIANGSGQLGKNLMFAGQAHSRATFELPHPMFGAKREFPFLDRTMADFYLTRDSRFAHPKSGICMFLLPHYNPIFQAESAADRGPDAPPLWGSALTARLRSWFLETRRLEVETFAEFFPHAGSFVELDPAVKDKFAQPVARVTTALHPATKTASEVLLGEGEAILAATGGRVERPPKSPGVYWFLQAGTARMVAKAADGVIGADGQAFDVKNLYVADGAALPSAGGAPFTLTIMANALRIGRGIADRAARGEL